MATDLLMKGLLLSLLLSLCSVLFNLTACSGQMDLGGQQRYVHTDQYKLALVECCAEYQLYARVEV